MNRGTDLPKTTRIRSTPGYVLFNVLGAIAGVLIGVATYRLGQTMIPGLWAHTVALAVGVLVCEVVVFGSRPIWGWT